MLDETVIADDGVSALCVSKIFANIERLHLAKTNVTPAGLLILASSQELLKLREVRYSVNQMSEEQIESLLREETRRFNVFYDCGDGR